MFVDKNLIKSEGGKEKVGLKIFVSVGGEACTFGRRTVGWGARVVQGVPRCFAGAK